MSKNVICLGNALIDAIVQLETDNTLSELDLPKGGMILVDKDVFDKIKLQARNLNYTLQTGGSAANTANGIANLGIGAGYIGMVGEDDFGEFYINDLLSNNIKPQVFKSKFSSSGTAIAFVSKDGERTFATYLGAAIELNSKLLKEEFFNNYHILHIEGYLIVNHELIKQAILLAKQNNLLISLDLASYNVVEENIEFLKQISKDVDIIFANEQEAYAFSGEKDAKKALDIIASYCKIAVVKIGKDGSLIKQGDKTIRISSKEKLCIDTTGAGDMYASGFLSGLCLDKTLEDCGKMGGILAEEVIGVYGAKIPKDAWQRINEEINNL